MTADRRMAWSFERAPFLHGWPAAIRAAEDASRMDTKELGAERTARSRSISESRALRIVALWWWVLPVAGISRWLGVVAAALMAGLGVRVVLKSAPVEST